MTGRFSNIMILSDIDGTFLGEHSRIIERNIEAIGRFKAEGGLFTFNTGRTHSNLYSVVPDAGTLANAPAGLSNGCCLFDLANNRPVINYLLDPEPALAAAKYIKSNIPDVGLRVSRTGGFLADPRDGIAVDNLKRMSANDVAFEPIESWRSDDWYKAVIIGEPERLAEVKAELNSVFGGAFSYEFSGRSILEIHRPDRSKASMIDTYRELYNKEGRNLKVYAVGDYDNDYEMLKAADVAVCPSNALDMIKNICDFCLSSNNEGVIADIVEMLEAECR
jgi:Cof subfamily protein (haloacid dehalogenase superfamily)